MINFDMNLSRRYMDGVQTQITHDALIASMASSGRALPKQWLPSNSRAPHDQTRIGDCFIVMGHALGSRARNLWQRRWDEFSSRLRRISDSNTAARMGTLLRISSDYSHQGVPEYLRPPKLLNALETYLASLGVDIGACVHHSATLRLPKDIPSHPSLETYGTFCVKSFCWLFRSVTC